MIATIGKFVLNWLWEKLLGLALGVLRRFKRHKEIDKEAEESKKPLDEANTEEEIDDAARDILDGF